jgi:hypothetical protein
MSDNGITDDQISASSALIAYTPDKARPYHHGWCSDFQDDQPFVEVTFIIKMRSVSLMIQCVLFCFMNNGT